MKKILNYKGIYEITLSTAAALLIGLCLGAVVLMVAGYDPLNAYAVMWSKISRDFGQVVGYATPLIFSGLAIAIPYSVNIFNLGAEGQMIAGSFAAAMVGIYCTGLPAAVHIPLTLLAGGAAGMLISTLIVTLKIKFNASETVVAIMLNSILLYLGEWAVNYPMRDDSDAPKTVEILETAVLPKQNLTDSYSPAIYIAIACAVLLWFITRKTVIGYEARATGFNAQASRYKGINIVTMALVGMMAGGFLAGLGGAGEVMGNQHCYYHGHVTDMGYTGVGVALVARKNPLAVIPSAFLFAAIRSGGMALDRLTNIPSYFIWILQGTIIIVLAVPELSVHFRRLFERIRQAGRRAGGKGREANG